VPPESWRIAASLPIVLTIALFSALTTASLWTDPAVGELAISLS
jgi:hypothetical protein